MKKIHIYPYLNTQLGTEEHDDEDITIRGSFMDIGITHSKYYFACLTLIPLVWEKVHWFFLGACTCRTF